MYTPTLFPNLPHLPSKFLSAMAHCSSLLAVKTAFSVEVGILALFLCSARSKSFFTKSYKIDWLYMPYVVTAILFPHTHFCCSLAAVFFCNKSSTITDCLLGSTARPFTWNPFIRLAVLETYHGINMSRSAKWTQKLTLRRPLYRTW